MFDFSIHLECSHTALDDSGCDFFTSYISDPMPLLYLFCRFYYIFVSLLLLCTIPLCGVAGLLKVISDLTPSLNHWVILLIRSGWDILRFVLMRSRLIVHPMKSSSSPIDQVLYFSWWIQLYPLILVCLWLLTCHIRIQLQCLSKVHLLCIKDRD